MESSLEGRAGGASDVINFRYYYYEPSLPAAIIFIVLFGLATLLHAFQMFKTRTWFMVPFLIGGIFETIGYIGRVLSASENPGPYNLGPYIIQAVLLLVAPALFAASIYMELARIVHMVDADKHLFIRRSWLTKIFVIGDVFSFLLQASGAGLLASGNVDTIDTGKVIVVVGLFAQLIFFGLFVLAAAIFHLRCSKNPTPLCFERPWHKHLNGLYIVSILILVRSVVRVVEYLEGYSGYIMTHEVFLYVFDAVPMFFAVISMNWIHPGEVAKHVREMDQGKDRDSEGAIRMDETSQV